MQDTQDRLVRRSEVARLLGRSQKTVDRLAGQGVLQRVVFPSHKRAAGFRLSDIASLIAGGTPAVSQGTATEIEEGC